MRRLGDHVALVVSLTALVVALGGTALASGYVITSSSQIKDGAVASADVKDSSLTGADLKDGAVASADVKNGSLTGADVKDHSLSPSDFSGSVAGPRGDPGPQGPAGPKGDTGSTPQVPLFAVSSGAVGSNLVRGRGATSAQRIDDGNYRVKFDRNISLCSWTGTASADAPPVSDAVSVRIALDTTDAGRTQLVVRTANAAGTPTNSPFHVQVVC